VHHGMHHGDAQYNAEEKARQTGVRMWGLRMDSSGEDEAEQYRRPGYPAEHRSLRQPH